MVITTQLYFHHNLKNLFLKVKFHLCKKKIQSI